MPPIPRSAGAIADAVRAGTLDPIVVVDAAIAVAERDGTRLGAIVHGLYDSARAAAERLRQRRDAGETLGPLAGVPVTVKDNIAIANAPLTAGSRILEHYRSPFGATAVERLIAADAVIIGKTNLDEFGMGSSTETSIFGPTRNPWDESRVCGGSSGGSAAAVAIGAGALSLGTDTGGSVRLPAALCGVVGLKPTYGRVSRYGVVAYGSSLDQIGVFAANVADAARALSIIAGPCDHDGTAIAGAAPSPLDNDIDPTVKLRGKRLGLPCGFLAQAQASDAAVATRVHAAIDLLRQYGATICEVDIADLDASVAAYYIIATAEASTNLSRYDGVRFGRRSDGHAGDIASLIGRSRAEGFGAEVQRRILLGTFALSSGYHDAYFDRACRVRRKLTDATKRALVDVDMLLTPTSPVAAWPLGAHLDDPTALYAMDSYTVVANLCGLPAISVPLAMAKGELPAGLQLIGRAMGEAEILGVAAAFECLRGPLPSLGRSA